MWDKKELQPSEIAAIYEEFRSPIMELDCGQKCAPFNERGIPFCCDIHHSVPTAHHAEWEYLQHHTQLWRPWNGESAAETAQLQTETPHGQVLLACLGPANCQRNFRSITCRTFPFFPYLDAEGKFLGISYYWEYEDRCWVISNLEKVSSQYRQEFITLYDVLIERLPDEKENFRYHSQVMRETFARRRRTIPLLHRNGSCYKISPKTGRMHKVSPDEMPKFEPYKTTSWLTFLDEENGRTD